MNVDISLCHLLVHGFRSKSQRLRPVGQLFNESEQAEQSLENVCCFDQDHRCMSADAGRTLPAYLVAFGMGTKQRRVHRVDQIPSVQLFVGLGVEVPAAEGSWNLAAGRDMVSFENLSECSNSPQLLFCEGLPDLIPGRSLSSKQGEVVRTADKARRGDEKQHADFLARVRERTPRRRWCALKLWRRH